ncbi:MAG TPA: hypothetical protein DCS74_05430 [Veillonellaceae bacterium]|jgi:asparagine N-glycosylation enzyme membrane subunit Stt3|nr:hypothetical protein [Veillonellaceae bacterium]
MMSTWIYILLLMMAANGILQAVSLSVYFPAVLIVNLAVLAASYFILKRDPLIDLRANMLFMLGLTAINILTDLGIMSYAMSWLAFGALFIWSMAGGGRNR